MRGVCTGCEGGVCAMRGVCVCAVRGVCTGCEGCVYVL